MDKYIFRLKNDKQTYIGKDYHSGGYPYETTDIFKACQYTNLQLMENYSDMFNKTELWQICLIKDVVLVPLENNSK